MYTVFVYNYLLMFTSILQLQSPSETVDCLSWEPVQILEHNRKAVESGAGEEMLLVASEDSEERRKSFVKVWENNEWGANVKSGPGSLLEFAKEPNK